MTKEISVDKKSVKDLLKSGSEKLFIIPEYQRPYVWSIEKIETLFDDIWQFATELTDENDKKTYFLGSIVSYENEKDEQEVIDGQQRITSLFLLLRAIYTKLITTEEKTKECEHFIREIEPSLWKINKYTGEVDYKKYLLKSEVINDDENEILHKILETGEVNPNLKDNYSKNYSRFLELFETASKNNPLFIYNFLDALLNKAILLPIAADDKDTALTIFSTLNDRGEPLSDSDIFKAEIYNHIEISERSDFIENWQTLSKEAEEASESMQKLFYYYMFYLRAEKSDIKTTTPGLRKYFSTEKFSKLYEKDLLPKLEIILNLWKVINKREKIKDEGWSENKDILKVLDSLNDYPNEFWKYPVIIYYLRYKDSINFENYFLVFLRRFYAFLLVKYLEKPTINAVKSDILKLNADIINTKEPRFNKLNIDGDEFKKLLKVPHPNTLRMLLKTVAYTDPDQKELLPEKWEIEHIFPQKWHSDYFLNITEEEVEEKIEHLGNKLPLEKKLNIIAGNGYFGKKKDEYNKSKIAIAKKMAKIDSNDWTLDDILERDIELTNLIKNVLINWINAYDNKKETPTCEDLKKIEEYRSKGWLD